MQMLLARLGVANSSPKCRVGIATSAIVEMQKTVGLGMREKRAPARGNPRLSSGVVNGDTQILRRSGWSPR